MTMAVGFKRPGQVLEQSWGEQTGTKERLTQVRVKSLTKPCDLPGLSPTHSRAERMARSEGRLHCNVFLRSFPPRDYLLMFSLELKALCCAGAESSPDNCPGWAEPPAGAGLDPLAPSYHAPWFCESRPCRRLPALVLGGGGEVALCSPIGELPGPPGLPAGFNLSSRPSSPHDPHRHNGPNASRIVARSCRSKSGSRTSAPSSRS